MTVVADPRPTRPRETHTAAVVATVVAVPVAALLAYFLINTATGAGAPEPAPTPATVQATSPVAMPAPQLDERSTVVCRALSARLPATLRDLGRRPVTAGPEQNAAYGEPPVTVACGGAQPTVQPTDFLITSDGVCWHAAAGPYGATVVSSVNREVPVRVTVPAGYDQQVQWANEFSGAIVQTVPSLPNPPVSCP
jgi:hypothetical protein